MKKPLAPSILTILLMPGYVAAAITHAALETFEQALWKTRTQFHIQTVMSGGAENQLRLDQALDQARTSLNQLRQEATREEETRFVSDLVSRWPSFEQAALSNTISELGYNDLYVVQDVDELPVLMSDAIRGFGNAEQADYDDVRALSTFLQRLASEYMARTANITGGGVGTGMGRLQFETAIPEFERRLANCREKYQEENLSRSLQQVETKWEFIRKSLISYNENTVPYLVNRYTEQMVALLNQAIRLNSPDQ